MPATTGAGLCGLRRRVGVLAGHAHATAGASAAIERGVEEVTQRLDRSTPRTFFQLFRREAAGHRLDLFDGDDLIVIIKLVDYPTALYLDAAGEVGTHDILTEAIRAACARLKYKSRRKLNRWVERLFLSSDKPLNELLTMPVQSVRDWFELFLLTNHARCTLIRISDTAGDMVQIKRGSQDVSELRVAVTGLARIWQTLGERGIRVGDNPFRIDSWSTMPLEERKKIAKTWGSRFDPGSYQGVRYAFKGSKAFKASLLNSDP